MDYNNITITGHLGHSPDVKSGNKGDFVVFPVAVNGYNDSTQWYDVTAFGNTAEACHKYLSKGDHVLVSGELTLRTFEKRDGTFGASLQIRANRVTFLSTRNSNEDDSPSGSMGDLPF